MSPSRFLSAKVADGSFGAIRKVALGLIVGLIIRWCMIRWRGKPAILQGDNTELANEAEMGQKTWGVIDPPHTDPNIATGAAPKSTSLMTHTDRALPAVPRDVHEGLRRHP